MRPTQHVLVSLAGALAFGAAGMTYCAVTERVYEAVAPVAIVAGLSGPTAIDLGAARSIVATEPILRRAALRPEAAAALERHSRPGSFDRLLSLFAAQSAETDTLSRAVAFLGPRVDVRAGPWPGMIELAARMPAAADAAAVATALAEAFVVDLNETALAARRRNAGERSERIDRAARALDEARARAQALRASDPAPVASITPKAISTARASAADAIDRLRREAADAAAHLAEAARTYGPRHPEMIRAENEARKTRGALESATRMAKASPPPTTAPTQAVAEGGPDPRAAEIAAAEDEAARAQATYDLETSRNETDRREARMLKPARAPAASRGPSGALIVSASAFSGLLLFGAAPMLPARRPRRLPQARDRQTARLRGATFSPAQARRALAGLAIGEGRGARRIAVVADDPDLAGRVARALAVAALSAGWRPLLVAEGSGEEGRPASLDGRPVVLRAERTRVGPLHVATATTATTGAPRPLDVARAYDLAVFGMTPARGWRDRNRPRVDCALRVGADVSDACAARLCKDLSLAAAQYAGTVIVDP